MPETIEDAMGELDKLAGIEGVTDGEIEAEIRKPRINKAATMQRSDYVSSGSTLINLAAAGVPWGWMGKGHYYWLSGISGSGKTWLNLTTFAEAANNPDWDDYDLIFDNPEDGALMDFGHFFGSKMEQRIAFPKGIEDGRATHSITIEDFYTSIISRLRAVQAGKARKFVWFLDSMDALTSKYEVKKIDEKIREADGGSQAKGDYGDGKAAMNSRYIRHVVHMLSKTGCVLIVVSQSRDNIDGGMFEPKNITAGGRALKYYATWQMFAAKGKKIEKTVQGAKYQTGMHCRVNIQKNRLTGKEWTVEVPIYHSYGLDEVGSCVQWLLDVKHWKGGGQSKINAVELGLDCRQDKLIDAIEAQNKEPLLSKIVTKKWREIEERLVLKRKKRYE